MTPFAKPVSELTVEDIQSLITEGVPEGSQLEFKEGVADRKSDAWATSRKIPDGNRNNILKSVVAFANSYGGTLIIGIRETNDKPPRASEIVQIPACHDLAEKIRYQIRDCVEPRISLYHSVGVATDEEGTGVVVVAVPRSLSAPHRLEPTKECFIRRSEHSEKMSMREIQGLTLNLARESDALTQKFGRLSARSKAALKSVIGEEHPAAIGFSAEAVPLNHSFQVERIYRDPRFRPITASEFKIAKREGGPLAKLIWLSVDFQEAPRLRAAEHLGDRGDIKARISVSNEGLVGFYFTAALSRRGGNKVPVEWILAMATNLILSVHKFRLAVGSSEAEYGMELRTFHHGPKCFMECGGDSYPTELGEFWPLVLPQYSIGPIEELDSLLTLIAKDLWNSMGRDLGADFRIEVDVSKQLEEIRATVGAH